MAIALKAMSANPDPKVCYTTVSGISFMLHEKSNIRVNNDYTLLTTKSQFIDAMAYAGKVIGKNHAISEQDYDAAIVPDNVDKEVTEVVSGNKAAFKDEIVNFAVDYATQVEYDYTSFVFAYNQGMPLY